MSYLVNNQEDFISILLQETALTAEQKTALRNELINDPELLGYSTKTDGQCLRSLCFGYYKEETIPSSTISNGYIPMGDLRVLLTREKSIDGVPFIAVLKLLSESTDLQTKILGVTINEVLNWEALNTSDPDVIAQFTFLSQMRILPEDLVNEILYTVIPERTEQVYQTPRNQVIFGDFIVPSLSEIAEARI